MGYALSDAKLIKPIADKPQYTRHQRTQFIEVLEEKLKVELKLKKKPIITKALKIFSTQDILTMSAVKAAIVYQNYILKDKDAAVGFHIDN